MDALLYPLVLKLASAVAALVVMVGGLQADVNALKSTSHEPQAYGALSGPDVYSPINFYQTATIGGNVFATSSQGTVTYTAASLLYAQLIQHTATAAVTATLPASSTMTSFAPKAGDTREIFLAPITSMVTLAGGTGTDLNTSSSTKACLAGSICQLQFVRKSNTDFEVLMTSSTGL